MSSMICLICLRSKGCLGCELSRRRGLVGISGGPFKSKRSTLAISDFAGEMRKPEISRKTGKMDAKRAKYSVGRPECRRIQRGRRREIHGDPCCQGRAALCWVELQRIPKVCRTLLRCEVNCALGWGGQRASLHNAGAFSEQMRDARVLAESSGGRVKRVRM